MNEVLLREKLAAVAGARAWAPGLVDRLGSLVRAEDPFVPYRVNPLRFARDAGASDADAVTLFLVAARAGLFTMQWDLLCTGCGDLVERFDSLSFMHSSYHCGICQTTYETTLEDSIEISFTVSPAVRDLPAAHPETLSAEDFYYKWLFNPGGLVPSGERYTEYIRPFVKFAGHLEPGTSAAAAFAVTAGVLTGFDGLVKTGFWVEVNGAPASSPQPLTFTRNGAGYESSTGTLRPGPVALTIVNPPDRRASAFLFNVPMNVPQHPTAYAPFLSAKKLFNHQAFRDLYRGQVLGGSESLSARDVVFLFTDLTGSTALYEKIGDVKAYALVRQHFDTLTGIIARRNGAIVKTIGDAVMASFSEPKDAAGAAAAMLEDIEAFNRARGGEDLLLKIGLHRGPCIAVTLNDRLDYFGQTVNVAARVQGLAGPEEICVTEEVWKAEGVTESMAAFTARTETAAVKGLAAPLPFRRLSPART